uniref:Probable glycerol kinase n=1 Tax=Strigamia maritima TaxID=126957 RepID=T1IIH9_STRMM
MGRLVGAIDQGTSSTRFMVFDSSSLDVVASHQVSVLPIYPQDGWVEVDPEQILQTVYTCIEETVKKLNAKGIDGREIAAVGISNQRETTVLWEKSTGKPLHNAIVWLDTRTTEAVDMFIQQTPGQNKDYLQYKCGLPLSTYFSAVKIYWLINQENESGRNIAQAIENENCAFGTIDSWILWNLTGGANGGVHVTDVTNASRTMLMNIETTKWDFELCKFFDIPMNILPEIRSSSEIYGTFKSGPLKDIAISGCLGDQSAALVGQMCFQPGSAKNTYGTGCFMLYNTGTKPIFSKHGLLTTVAYKFGEDEPVRYAIEGSVAIAGACINWLKDNLGLIDNVAETETLASSVDGTHGVYFVPAFSGLFAPHWESEAKGLIFGLTQYTKKAHLVRAAFEAICFQTREILDAMNKDSNIALSSLKVDGGLSENNFLMQLQSNTIGMSVVRPDMRETTALGAAIAAACAKGIDVMKLDSSQLFPLSTKTFIPEITEDERNTNFEGWQHAVHLCIHSVKTKRVRRLSGATSEAVHSVFDQVYNEM